MVPKALVVCAVSGRAGPLCPAPRLPLSARRVRECTRRARARVSVRARDHPAGPGGERRQTNREPHCVYALCPGWGRAGSSNGDPTFTPFGARPRSRLPQESRMRGASAAVRRRAPSLLERVSPSRPSPLPRPFTLATPAERKRQRGTAAAAGERKHAAAALRYLPRASGHACRASVRAATTTSGVYKCASAPPPPRVHMTFFDLKNPRRW